MGIIRRTASISTLGLVSFRSPREKKKLAEAKLLREQAKSVRADRKSSDQEPDN